MPTTTLRRGLVVAIASLTLCGIAACSSDDSDSSDTTTTTTTEATTTTADSGGESAATIKFDKTIQQELADVGCHPGEVDGVIGPKTDEAIVAFQEAAGLDADGELGPETETALKDAVDEGTKVCEDATTTTTTGGSTTTTAGSTTTAPSGGQAPCTATALLAGLPSEGESLSTYQCDGGYAAGILNDGTTRFILQSDGGKWVALSDDPCGSASAGIPAAILTEGCGA